MVFQLVSSRYEHASLILTSNLPFSGWGGVFGDQAVAAAMIDRIVHHADVLTLKGASYRLRNRGPATKGRKQKMHRLMRKLSVAMALCPWPCESPHLWPSKVPTSLT